MCGHGHSKRIRRAAHPQGARDASADRGSRRGADVPPRRSRHQQRRRPRGRACQQFAALPLLPRQERAGARRDRASSRRDHRRPATAPRPVGLSRRVPAVARHACRPAKTTALRGRLPARVTVQRACRDRRTRPDRARRQLRPLGSPDPQRAPAHARQGRAVRPHRCRPARPGNPRCPAGWLAAYPGQTRRRSPRSGTRPRDWSDQLPPHRRRLTSVDDDEHRTHDEQEGDTNMSTPFGALKQADAGPLSVGYADAGPAGGPAVMLLHGWPYDIHSFAEVTPVLASAGYRVIVPFVRGYGTTRFLSDDTLRNGQQAALAADVIALMDALGIDTAILAGFDWGARSADVVAALWPDRCRALVSVSGYLIGTQAASQAPLPPQAELAWWYQFYFATDRGQAGYEKYRREFSKLIWRLASPKWVFDDATFARSAAAFDNPDHVAVVIDNYRWRLGLAAGESQYDDLERRVGGFSGITLPTLTP